MMKKIRMFLILLLTAALAFPAAFAEDGSTGADTDSASSLDMKSFPFYTEGSGAEPFAAAFPLYFADGVDDLPYVGIRSVLTILNAAVGTDIFNGAELTGGGSCVVLPMSSAWGSLYQISGPVRISFVKNGSFYDADRDVDPGVYLTKAETYYDREKLTELINGLQ